MSRCRTNFHSENEANINKQINMELYASYVYLSMVSSVDYSYTVFTSYLRALKFTTPLNLTLKIWLIYLVNLEFNPNLKLT